MMSLLLTFFILLLSFATLDRVQFDKLSGVLKEGFGVISKTDKQRIPKRDTMIKINQRMKKNSRQPNSAGDEVRRLMDQINATSINDQTKRALEMLVQANDVKVSLPADDVFLPLLAVVPAVVLRRAPSLVLGRIGSSSKSSSSIL